MKKTDITGSKCFDWKLTNEQLSLYFKEICTDPGGKKINVQLFPFT